MNLTRHKCLIQEKLLFQRCTCLLNLATQPFSNVTCLNFLLSYYYNFAKYSLSLSKHSLLEFLDTLKSDYFLEKLIIHAGRRQRSVTNSSSLILLQQ